MKKTLIPLLALTLVNAGAATAFMNAPVYPAYPMSGSLAGTGGVVVPLVITATPILVRGGMANPGATHTVLTTGSQVYSSYNRLTSGNPYLSPFPSVGGGLGSLGGQGFMQQPSYFVGGAQSPVPFVQPGNPPIFSGVQK